MCATAPRSQPPLLKHCASHAKVVACEQINVHGRVAAIEKHQFPWKRSTFVREQTFVHGKRVVNNYVVHGRAAASEKHQFPWKRSTFVREQTFVHGMLSWSNLLFTEGLLLSKKHYETKHFLSGIRIFMRDQQFASGQDHFRPWFEILELALWQSCSVKMLEIFRIRGVIEGEKLGAEKTENVSKCKRI